MQSHQSSLFPPNSRSSVQQNGLPNTGRAAFQALHDRADSVSGPPQVELSLRPDEVKLDDGKARENLCALPDNKVSAQQDGLANPQIHPHRVTIHAPNDPADPTSEQSKAERPVLLGVKLEDGKAIDNMCTLPDTKPSAQQNNPVNIPVRAEGFAVPELSLIHI